MFHKSSMQRSFRKPAFLSACFNLSLSSLPFFFILFPYIVRSVLVLIFFFFSPKLVQHLSAYNVNKTKTMEKKSVLSKNLNDIKGLCHVRPEVTSTLQQHFRFFPLFETSLQHPLSLSSTIHHTICPQPMVTGLF